MKFERLFQLAHLAQKVVDAAQAYHDAIVKHGIGSATAFAASATFDAAVKELSEALE